MGILFFLVFATSGQFNKYFTSVTYGHSKISLCILKTLHGSHVAYFARAVNYTSKTCMTFTTFGSTEQGYVFFFTFMWLNVT
jgi:hypothetical protein